MSEQKSPSNNGVPIKNAGNYHWWYDAKSAGVSNSPPTNYGRSPPNAGSFMSTSPTGSSFMSTSPSSVTGINPSAAKRRDSLKNMYHLCDFATPK